MIKFLQKEVDEWGIVGHKISLRGQRKIKMGFENTTKHRVGWSSVDRQKLHLIDNTNHKHVFHCFQKYRAPHYFLDMFEHIFYQGR